MAEIEEIDGNQMMICKKPECILLNPEPTRNVLMMIPQSPSASWLVRLVNSLPKEELSAEQHARVSAVGSSTTIKFAAFETWLKAPRTWANHISPTNIYSIFTCA